MIYSYKNEYGELEVESISKTQSLHGWYVKDLPDDIKFDLDTAEKIVLITENRKSQITGDWFGNKMCVFVYHISPSDVQICKINKLIFTSSVNPTEELEKFGKRDATRVSPW